jgi:hypothetical protein
MNEVLWPPDWSVLQVRFSVEWLADAAFVVRFGALLLSKFFPVFCT